jgi:hypothetical protein
VTSVLKGQSNLSGPPDYGIISAGRLGGSEMMRPDRFEIDADRFESFQGSQPVRSLRCGFRVWENRREFRGLGVVTRVSGAQRGAAWCQIGMF